MHGIAERSGSDPPLLDLGTLGTMLWSFLPRIFKASKAWMGCWFRSLRGQEGGQYHPVDQVDLTGFN